jgi:hypothetical protein
VSNGAPHRQGSLDLGYKLELTRHKAGKKWPFCETFSLGKRGLKDEKKDVKGQLNDLFFVSYIGASGCEHVDFFSLAGN